MNEIKATIKKADGNIEIKNMDTIRFPKMTAYMFGKISESVKKTGDTLVEIKETRTETTSNLATLVRDYNNLHNEGGEGFVPNNDYFKNLPAYKETTKKIEKIWK